MTNYLHLGVYSDEAFDLFKRICYASLEESKFEQAANNEVVYRLSSYSNAESVKRSIVRHLLESARHFWIEADIAKCLVCLVKKEKAPKGSENLYKTLKGVELDPFTSNAIAVIKSKIGEANREASEKFDKAAIERQKQIAKIDAAHNSKRDKISAKRDAKVKKLSEEIDSIKEKFIKEAL